MTLGNGLVLCLDLLGCAELPPSPSPFSRASRGLVIVLFCNALDCIALRCTAAALLRQAASCVTLGASSGCVTSSHLVSCCSTCHQQACFVDVSGMKLG